MASTAKVFASVLLVLLLSNAMLPAANGQIEKKKNPIECLLTCGVKLVTCALGCGGNFICLFGCGGTDIKCASHCCKKKNGIAEEVPSGYEEVTGRLEESGNEMETVKAVAVISSSSSGENSVKGSLQFHQDFAGGRTQIKGIIAGLYPGLHGLHIQLVSSCSSMDGPHFNPENKEYGSQSAEMHRAYCLGNVISNPNGIAHGEISIEEKDMPLNGPNSVLGRAVIVHADEKVGCGIIEIK